MSLKQWRKFVIKHIHIIILILICLISLGIRLEYASQSPDFASDESYYNIRQIEHIMETGSPIIKDELRETEASAIQPVLYHYIMATLSLAFPAQFALKTFPALFASLVVVVVYLITLHITRNKNAALLSAFFSAGLPVYVKLTSNVVEVSTLFAPLLLFALYCMLRIEKQLFMYLFIASLVALSLISKSAIIIVLIFLCYLILVKLENLKQIKYELEIILFSALFILWVTLIFFKKPFLEHGAKVIWLNIPTEILSQYFSELTIIGAIVMIGLVPLLLAIIVTYKSLFVDKHREIHLFIGFGIITGILLYLRLIQLEIGLMYLGLIMCILAAPFYKWTMDYLKKTFIADYSPIFPALLMILFIITSGFTALGFSDSINENTPTHKEIEALKWLEENSASDSIVLALPEEGHIVSYYAKRKSVLDSEYLLVSDVDEKMKDMHKIFGAIYETEAIRLLNKYNVDYIYFSSDAKRKYGVDQLAYVNDKKCFTKQWDEGVQIYKLRCII